MTQTRTDIIDDDADGADHEHERPFSEKVADAVALVMDEPGVEHAHPDALTPPTNPVEVLR